MSNFKNYLNTYVFETVLPGRGDTISFKPITTGQIKKLLLYETSNEPMSMEDALDEMINECIDKPENFDVKKLYLQDRFFLLVEIRKATRGNIYSFQSECTSCGSQSQQIVKLSDLSVTYLNKNVKVEKKESITEKKPTTKKTAISEKKKEVKTVTYEAKEEVNDWNIVKLNENISVKLSLITRDMQIIAFNMIKEKYKNGEMNEIQRTLELTTILYALSIESIITPEGEESDVSMEDKIFLLDNIQQSEQEKISNWYDVNDFGIDFSFDVECMHCHNKERKAVPVENFFY